MSYKKLLTIQDISCVGQCSLTVALPVISALGVEAAVLPTSLLSNHTMFSAWTKCDLDEEVDKIFKMWQEQKIDFDGLVTGYIGNSNLVNALMYYYSEENGKCEENECLICKQIINKSYIIITVRGSKAPSTASRLYTMQYFYVFALFYFFKFFKY